MLRHMLYCFLCSSLNLQRLGSIELLSLKVRKEKPWLPYAEAHALLLLMYVTVSAEAGEHGAAFLEKEEGEAMAPESGGDEDEGLAKLLTPGRMHDSASTARFNVAETAPGASPSQGADAARSAGPSTSEDQQERCRLPPELAEEPPDPVDPAIQVCSYRVCPGYPC